MKPPRFSLRSLLLVCTAFCVYFTIGKLAPLLAVAIFCLLSVLAAQAAAMRLAQLDTSRGFDRRSMLFLVALIATIAFALGVIALVV